MREETETTNWFSRWEEQLPSPEELMPLSQTLITPDLALAFDIPNPNSSTNQSPPHQPHHQPSQHPQTPSQPHPAEFDSPEFTAGSNGDEQNRTLKRPRLVWTPQLHKRFVDAVAHLGIKNAVPKTIMQLMSVDGLTRENVASHLQKYRLYLKRMQGLSGGAGGTGANVSPAEAAEHHLFASAPVPHHFLHRGGAPLPAPEHYLPFVPVLQHHHHHHQMAAAAAAQQQQQQQQLYHHRHVGHHFGSPPGGGGGFDHGFLPRQGSLHGGIIGAVSAPLPYVEDLESEAGGAGRKVLTLFPTGDD